jgi:anthranilate/para-aminobenzoate synthase component I
VGFISVSRVWSIAYNGRKILFRRRVSEYGSVKIGNLMYVERYSHVMHLVSALEGRLRPELNAMDAFAACFPAGTLSGAPKVRALQIIEELEPTRRGVLAVLSSTQTSLAI